MHTPFSRASKWWSVSSNPDMIALSSEIQPLTKSNSKDLIEDGLSGIVEMQVIFPRASLPERSHSNSSILQRLTAFDLGIEYGRPAKKQCSSSVLQFSIAPPNPASSSSEPFEPSAYCIDSKSMSSLRLSNRASYQTESASVGNDRGAEPSTEGRLFSSLPFEQAGTKSIAIALNAVTSFDFNSMCCRPRCQAID